MNKKNILVVEDDKAISALLSTMAEMNGYGYHTASTGTSGIMDTMSYCPDVILLDLGLPDMDGIDFIRKVRTWTNTPIIVVSARSDFSDKIEALNSGADDYLTKPFNVDELLARLRVALRRNTQMQEKEEQSVFENGSLRIDYSSQCVYVNDEEVHLTPNEYKLLVLLSHNTGRVLTHSYILKEIWGSVNSSDLPSLRVFMTNLRKKLGDSDNDKLIQTHVGVGYRMLKK